MDVSLDQTIDATDFQSRCAEVLEQVRVGTLHRVDVTKDGKVIAVLTSPKTSLFGYLRGSVTIPEGFDLTSPVFDDTIHADEGRVHE